MDESGAAGKTKHVLVGGVVTSVLPSLEDQISRLYELQVENPRLAGSRSFRDFQNKGFHNSGDPTEIKQYFIDQMTRLHGYRGFAAFTAAADLGRSTAEVERDLYAGLLPDILIYCGASEVCVVFENNEALDRLFTSIVDEALAAARRKSKKPLPTVRSVVATKKQLKSLAVVDYCLAVVAQWLDAGSPEDPQAFQYRNYRAVRENMAVIHDVDRQRRISRRNRDLG